MCLKLFGKWAESGVFLQSGTIVNQILEVIEGASEPFSCSCTSDLSLESGGKDGAS